MSSSGSVAMMPIPMPCEPLPSMAPGVVSLALVCFGVLPELQNSAQLPNATAELFERANRRGNGT
ncbi:hypothetical protein D9M71_438650 [compost metagenome]